MVLTPESEAGAVSVLQHVGRELDHLLEEALLVLLHNTTYEGKGAASGNGSILITISFRVCGHNIEYSG